MTKYHKIISKTSRVHILCKPLQLKLQEGEGKSKQEKTFFSRGRVKK